MDFVCIMGLTGSGKSTIEKLMERYGYKRSVSYTTREPQVRNGVLEQNGNEYKFVTEERFKALVEANAIIEFEKYGDNYYGTPEPIGSDRHVAVLCIKGFKALKEKYGDQVIGIYLKCDPKVNIGRIESRHDKEEVKKLLKRFNNDLRYADEMEGLADLIVDASKEPNEILRDILVYINSNRKVVNN